MVVFCLCKEWFSPICYESMVCSSEMGWVASPQSGCSCHLRWDTLGTAPCDISGWHLMLLPGTQLVPGSEREGPLAYFCDVSCISRVGKDQETGSESHILCQILMSILNTSFDGTDPSSPLRLQWFPWSLANSAPEPCARYIVSMLACLFQCKLAS